MEYVASHSGFMHWNQQLQSISSPKGKGEARPRPKKRIIAEASASGKSAYLFHIVRFLNSMHMMLRCCHLCDTDLFFVDESYYHGRLYTKIGCQCECEVVAAGYIIDVSAQPSAQTRTELMAESDESEENRHVPGAEEIPRQRRSERDGRIQERPMIMGVAQTVKSFLKKMNRTNPSPRKP